MSTQKNKKVMNRQIQVMSILKNVSTHSTTVSTRSTRDRKIFIQKNEKKWVPLHLL